MQNFCRLGGKSHTGWAAMAGFPLLDAPLLSSVVNTFIGYSTLVSWKRLWLAFWSARLLYGERG